MVAAIRRRKMNTTSITRTDAASSVHCMSATLARIVPVRSDITETSMPCRNPLLDLGNEVHDAVNGRDHVGVALPCDGQQHRRLTIEPGEGAAVAGGVVDTCHVAEPHDVAVRRLDDDVAQFGGTAHLRVGRDGFRLPAAFERSERCQRVGVDDGVRTSSIDSPGRCERARD